MAAFANRSADSCVSCCGGDDSPRNTWPHAGAQESRHRTNMGSLPRCVSLGAALRRQLFLSGVSVHARAQRCATPVSPKIQLAKNVAKQVDFSRSLRRYFVHLRTFQLVVLALVDGFIGYRLLCRCVVDRWAFQACVLLQVRLSDWPV